MTYHHSVVQPSSEIWNFGSFAALPLETLVAKYYKKVPLVNAETPQVQFGTFQCTVGLLNCQLETN